MGGGDEEEEEKEIGGIVGGEKTRAPRLQSKLAIIKKGDRAAASLKLPFMTFGLKTQKVTSSAELT